MVVLGIETTCDETAAAVVERHGDGPGKILSNIVRSQTDEPHRMRSSRIATVIWASVLFVLALLCLHRIPRVVEVGLQIASIAYGALLGVFLLGVLTRRATERGAMVGMLLGFVSEVYLWQFTRVPWTWYVAMGTTVTFAVGYVVSVMLGKKSKSS